MSNTEKLLAMKKDIANKKLELARLTGEKDTFEKAMKTDYNCANLEQLHRVRKRNVEELEKIRDEIKSKMKELSL